MLNAPKNTTLNLYSSHADSSLALTKSTVSFLLEDKHVVNEHHVIQKSHDTTQ